MSTPVSLQESLTQQEKLKLLQAQIDKYQVLLYMKGTPNQPLCGFSQQAVIILQQCGAPFKSFNVLDPSDKLESRKLLPKLSDWPTFPQLYIEGHLIGGVDIMTTLYASGELGKQLSKYITTDVSERNI